MLQLKKVFKLKCPLHGAYGLLVIREEKASRVHVHLNVHAYSFSFFSKHTYCKSLFLMVLYFNELESPPI